MAILVEITFFGITCQLGLDYFFYELMIANNI